MDFEETRIVSENYANDNNVDKPVIQALQLHVTRVILGHYRQV